MADLSDVESVLVTIVSQVIYPNGTGSPSIVDTPCEIYRGWPIPANLDADLAAGTINISVFPKDDEQKTTKYQKKWLEKPVAAPLLTITAAGDTLTLAGTPSSPLNVATIVNGVGCVYPVQLGDTLTSIATGLATLVSEITPATSSGSVVTIPAAHTLVARIAAIGSVIREVKRQKRSMLISFWCPSSALRDAIVPPCDLALADTDYLSLPDGTLGRLIYVRSIVSDRQENENLYRRDLVYSVEYGTTETMSAPQVAIEKFNISGGPDPSAPPVETMFL